MKLNDMINNKGQKVYVHCTAGMGRAPATVMLYLCLFKKVEFWNDIEAVDKYIKSFRMCSTPNLEAVSSVIEENRHFQSQQS